MRIGHKKLGLSKKLEDECLNHHITIRFNAKKTYDDVKGSVEDAFSDVGNFVTNDLKKFGADVLTYSNPVYWANKTVEAVDKNILNNNLDIYTGGLVKDASGAVETVRDLGRDYEIETNLKQAARVSVVAAGTGLSGGTGTKAFMAGLTTSKITEGLSLGSWADIGKALSATLPTPKVLKDIVNSIPSGKSNNGGGYAVDTSAGLVNLDTRGKLIPIVIIGTIVLGGIIIISSKKKKRK